ncbi:MAG TPA: carbohydrate kinase family protein [Vicinamibacteria bacterium]|nr:carbohydrate kinase family protein [Vicinamibacteria bacterium]
MTPDLVVLGNLLVDDIVFTDGRTRMGEAGGATLYGAATATLWEARVGIASLRGPEYPQRVLDALAERGADLSGVTTLPANLRTWLLYEGGRRRLVHHLDSPSHTQASPVPDGIPSAWRSARAFHLAPMPLPVQHELVGSLSGGPGLVSLDPHDPIETRSLDAWRPVLDRTDVLWLGREELELGREDDPLPTLRALAGGRLRSILWKRGPRGGWLYDVGADRLEAWTPRTTAVVDPTGAGDAFAVGFLCGILAGEPPARALARAVVSASFAIEDWGASALLRATPEHAAARLREWFPA